MTGTAHLIAVSGSHLGYRGVCDRERIAKDSSAHVVLQRAMLAMALAGLHCLYGRVALGRARVLHGVRRRLSSTAPGVVGMALSALFVTMSIFVLLRPTVLFEMGFQLSCASVFAILCFCPYATYALGELGVPSGVASMFVRHAVLAAGDTSRYHSRLRDVFAHCPAWQMP